MNHNRLGRKIWLGSLFIIVACLAALAAPVKVKTVVDGAAIKSTPQIGAKTLAKLPLNTVLEAQEKKDEWYHVTFDKAGTPTTGFVHEMLVQEIPEEVGPGPAVTSSGPGAKPDLAGEIEAKVETAKEAIRQQRNLDQASESLDSLLAKVLALGDLKKQRSLAVEIYLWMGLSRLASGRDSAALREFQKMFDIDPVAAKEATRNIATPKVDALLKLAEQQSQGLITEFVLEITTQPPAAEVFADGRSLGPTPGSFRWPSPKISLEVRKAGFLPFKDELLLTEATTKKDYSLEPLKRDLSLTSTPSGAAVFIDGQPTERVTDCKLGGLTYGPHEVRLVLDGYQDWKGSVTISEDEQPALLAPLVGMSYVPVASFGTRWSDVLIKPTSLVLDAQGFLYVTDDSGARVKKFSTRGEPLPDWKVQAPELGELKTIAAAAYDGQGSLWLVDSKRGLVLKISPDGKSAVTWNGLGGGTSEFRQPLGVAFDRAGNSYVLDAGNNRVKKYSARNDYLRTWGVEGTGNGQFTLPRAIVLSTQDEVYVLDKTRVQKFSTEGEFLAAWGEAGSGEGQFASPQGLAVDAAGCVYVADTDNHRVHKFGADGRTIVRWGTKGKDAGQFNEPIGVLADAKGNVYVLERYNERVQVFGVGIPAAQK